MSRKLEALFVQQKPGQMSSFPLCEAVLVPLMQINEIPQKQAEIATVQIDRRSFIASLEAFQKC